MGKTLNRPFSLSFVSPTFNYLLFCPDFALSNVVKGHTQPKNKAFIADSTTRNRFITLQLSTD